MDWVNWHGQRRPQVLFLNMGKRGGLGSGRSGATTINMKVGYSAKFNYRHVQNYLVYWGMRDGFGSDSAMAIA